MTEQDKKVDRALSDLMTAEHSLANAQSVLAEHINDLQERIEELEAENKSIYRGRSMLQAENDRLREAIENAPHHRRCAVFELCRNGNKPLPCDCWKAKALGEGE